MPELRGKVYTVEEVAKQLRVDPSTVRRWCQTGALTQGKDFISLPHAGKRQMYRFTQEQFDRLTGNPPAEE